MNVRNRILLVLTAVSLCAPNGRTAPLPSEAASKGRAFLVNLFEPKMGLLPEYRGAHVYWLFHDNYLAAKVLKESNPKTSGNITWAIQREGAHATGRMGLLFGETNAWPFREYQLVDVRHMGDKTIRNEIEVNRLIAGWENYADLLLLASIAESNRGNSSAARQHWEAALRMWDGKGFLDAAARVDGRYSTYKLGLALLAASRLSPRGELPQGLQDKLLMLQDSSGGWITDYDAAGNKIGLANVETTCLAILGIEAVK
jgi:hypothetical protein